MSEWFCLLLAAQNFLIAMMNSLLGSYSTPCDTVPFDQIKHEDFLPAFEEAFRIGREEIAAITDNHEVPTFKNTIAALDSSGELLNRVSSILFNLNSAETDDRLQGLAREISPKLSEFSNDITLNTALFARVKEVYELADKSVMTAEEQMLLDKTYKQFVRSGANLLDEKKIEFREVTKELAELTVKFGENVLAETNAFTLHITETGDLSGLPEDVIHEAAEEAKSRELEGWVFTLQFPSFVPFMKYAQNRELRKQMAIAYNSRGLHNNEHDNKEVILRITTLRLKLANLLGYETFADFVLSERMAESTLKVQKFLKELLTASLPAARNEVQEVQEYADRNGAQFDLQSWDWSYYSEKLKKEKYNVDDEVTRPYFSLENVQNGVFDLANRLYGLTFSRNRDIPVYHADVVAFEVFDENKDFLAILYMDFFPRKGKRQGAWMTEYIEQHVKGDKDIRPHVSLVFNFTKPGKEKPSLLTYNEVRTLLHEFGHALHGMLSRVNYSSLSGTSVYRDFVELPSQLLENWAEQPEWLDGVAAHYKTGEKMPVEILNSILESKNFLEGYASVRQISFGLTDMAWHSLRNPFGGDIIAFEKKAMEPTQLLPPVEGTAMSPSFGHIFAGGYAAGYYGYKWAEVLDADAFSLFKAKGIYDKTVAASFRENILSKGGTEHPMRLYMKFRGHEPSIEPLLERSGLIVK